MKVGEGENIMLRVDTQFSLHTRHEIKEDNSPL